MTFESAEPKPPEHADGQLQRRGRIDILEQHLVRDPDALLREQHLESRDLFLHALLIGRQGVDKAVEGRAHKTADDQQDGDHARHDEQYRNHRGHAFPLEPEHRRRPEHGEENGDEEGHQDRLRLIDAPDDDHERSRDDEDADSPLRIALITHGRIPLRQEFPCSRPWQAGQGVP